MRTRNATAEPDDCPLGPHEMEVLRLLANGQTDREIARLLRIPPRTARIQIASIVEALGVSTRTEAIALAFRRGWFRLPDDPPRLD